MSNRIEISDSSQITDRSFVSIEVFPPGIVTFRLGSQGIDRLKIARISVNGRSIIVAGGNIFNAASVFLSVKIPGMIAGA